MLQERKLEFTPEEQKRLRFAKYLVDKGILSETAPEDSAYSDFAWKPDSQQEAASIMQAMTTLCNRMKVKMETDPLVEKKARCYTEWKTYERTLETGDSSLQLEYMQVIPTIENFIIIYKGPVVFEGIERSSEVIQASINPGRKFSLIRGISQSRVIKRWTQFSIRSDQSSLSISPEMVEDISALERVVDKYLSET